MRMRKRHLSRIAVFAVAVILAAGSVQAFAEATADPDYENAAVYAALPSDELYAVEDTASDSDSAGLDGEATADGVDEVVIQAEAEAVTALSTFAATYAEPLAEATYTSRDYRDSGVEYAVSRSMSLNLELPIGGYAAGGVSEEHKVSTGFRFAGVEIPEGAEIADAYLEFTASTAGNPGDSANIQVRLQRGTPSYYTYQAGNITRRTYLSTVLEYEQDAFEAEGQKVRTANLKELLEANLENGWVSGRALAFRLDGDNYIGCVYPAASALAPVLVIRYEGEGEPEPGSDFSDIAINEVAPKGTEGMPAPWIELYNRGDEAVTFAGDAALETASGSAALAGVTVEPKGFALLALGEEGVNLPLAEGDDAILLVADGETVDSFELMDAAFGETLGRFHNGDAYVVKYVEGSPGATNDFVIPVLRYAVSHEAGDYDEGFELEILSDPVNKIVYTLDGSDPSQSNGTVYEGPISITESTLVQVLVYNLRQSTEILSFEYMIGEDPGDEEEPGENMREFTREFRLQSGSDDAMANGQTARLTDGELGLHGKVGTVDYDSYLRFAGVELPEDAIIKSAYLVFTARQNTSGSPVLTITGELGDGAAFTTAPASFAQRVFSDASAAMAMPATLRRATANSADLASVLREMREHDPEIRNYVFRIEGDKTGSSIVYAYDRSADWAPRLVIEYYSEYGEYSQVMTDRNNDAEEYGAGKAVALGTDPRIGGYRSATLSTASKQVTAFRFPGVELPEDATITDAYIAFTTLATGAAGRVSNQVIRAELGDGAAFTTQAGSISGRTYGELAVGYQQASFTTALATVRTPNLKSIIDENRLMGWQDGQAMSFLIDGDNYVGSVYQGGSAYAPRLVIQYKLGGGADGGDTETNPDQIERVYINEVAPKGTGVSAAPWVELYNDNDVPVILGDGIALGGEALANVLIPAKGFRVVYPATIPEDTALALRGPGGELDRMELWEVAFDETLGRFRDGDEHVVKYLGGTFGDSNTAAIPVLRYAVSHATGQYDKAFAVEILTDSANEVRYTLDRTDPSADAGAIYDGPIAIAEDTELRIFIHNERQNTGVLTYEYRIGSKELELRENEREFRLQSGSDDAVANASTARLTDGDLNLHGVRGSAQYDTYLRFAGVEIPDDAMITNAYLVFTSRQPSQGAPSITVTGELGEGAAFTNSGASFSARRFTTASVEMQVSGLKKYDAVNTANISRVLNEMRAFNPEIQDYVFRIEGDKTGSNIIYAYDRSADWAPRLVVEYESGYGESVTHVAHNNDDAEEYGTAGVVTRSGNMHMGGYRSTSLTAANKQITAVRFQNVELPADAEIVDAFIEFTASTRGTAGRSANVTARVELGNAAEYGSSAYGISGRTYGFMQADFTMPAFTAVRQSVRTGNLKAIIDENRLMGWQSGQSLAFRFDGDNFVGNVYHGGGNYAPKLVIRYKYSGVGPFIDGAETDPAKIRNVYVNEVSGQGTSSSKETWVELYNDNDYPVVLGPGTYLGKTEKKNTKHEFTNLLIPAKGFRVIYCDESPDKGNDHADLECSSTGQIILSTTGDDGKVMELHRLTYGAHAYNQTWGLKADGGDETVMFHRETFGRSNNDGLERYELALSHQRGVYETGFELTLYSKAGTTIRYTTDGTVPTETNGNTYSKPIRIDQSTVLKLVAYDKEGNSGVLYHTYVLLDNWRNEKAGNGFWAYKSNITSEQYAEAMAELPIVSVSGDLRRLTSGDYQQGALEFIDAHVGGENYAADVGLKKFGQASAAQTVGNVGIRFKRDYNSTKAKYAFFAGTVENAAYPINSKFARLDLKEGQDGPQNDIYNLGYLRYDEQVTSTLAKQMEQYALNTRYVHYFFNGQYYGVKTMREHFNDNQFEDYFGGDSDDYTRIRFQDGTFPNGGFDSDDDVTDTGKAILNKIRDIKSKKDFQAFKQYADVDDFIKTHILFMFIDSEREIDAVVHNDVMVDGATPTTLMKFNINDNDGAFYNNGRTGTAASAFAGMGGTYRYKWLHDRTSRLGAGGLFGAFSGDSTNPAAGNLEFKTLVKDQVLEQIGPASGNFRGADGAPLSVDNVKSVIAYNQELLQNPYRLDAAFKGARRTIYQDWQKANVNVLNQVDDRVRFSLEMWLKYNMAHTLERVEAVPAGGGVTLTNPNGNTLVYYTVDGSDPMGPDGVVSSSAHRYEAGTVINGGSITVRPFTTNNWGPLTTA